MTRIATIRVYLKGKTFVSEFPINDYIQEYQIADEAWRLALHFADTQAIAMYGHDIPSAKFNELLNDLDYTYEIKEI